MKPNRSILTVMLLIICSYHAISAEKSSREKADSIKTGWNLGALPAISFDTDLGFQYGALVNFFDYGDGKRFPSYNHSLYFEVSRFTKGSGVYRFYYTSDQLIKNIDLSLDMTYLTDQAHDFYGFNGFESVLNKEWEDEENAGYKTRMFYKFDQRQFRFKADLQQAIGDSPFKWVAGANLQNFALSSVDLEKLNKNKSGQEILPDVPGLFEKYQEWNIISQGEANGGFVPELKGGLVYDTREAKVNPMKGIWTEAILTTAPKILGAESGFTRLSLTHRQYFTVVRNDLSFAYRLGWQQTIGGHVPFYFQNQMITTVMTGYAPIGLGGSRYLRGARRNRVYGDGVVYGNFELRWKFARMNFINQKFYWGLNAFADMGRVTRKIDFRIPVSIAPGDGSVGDYFDPGAEKMHGTYGLGIRLAMNQNFVVSCDYGRVMNRQDGDTGVYVGLHYLF